MQLIRLGRGRDLRVDFFRGLALWWIYTDHIPGDVLASYSLRNFAMCDATEVFVLLAGYGAGLAYGGTMDRQGVLYAMADVIKRAWILYVAHIFLFVVFTAQVAYSALALDRGFYLDEMRLNILAEDPYRGLLEALLLRFQPSLLNILPLYVVLLVFFAGALPLLRLRWVLLTLSASSYVAVRLTGVNLGSWTGEDWYFDPLAWQFLFAIGAVLAYAPPKMPRRRWPFDLIAGLVLIAGLSVISFEQFWPSDVERMPEALVRLLFTEDKTGLHPFRLLSILGLAWLVVRLMPMDARFLRSKVVAPLVLMGQNSLPVFCSGIFFGLFARLGLEYDDHTPMQIGVNLFGAVGMVTVGIVVSWYRIKGHTSAPGQRALPVVATTDRR